ncbi:HypC/HybG/HupF family hydrogenase formation chaperone [Halonotius aquaticus]|jgi:hydrogenase expression/formation protein HypC|uniref:HypC/HybG/HupF family hydrogenase formation chaperone n=1 Tax=Halonotius aquaticus TaxID=2216978 RepID=A0A3A6PUE3_9EURY|nr:HypC/HybG/HupF family hydrogenase formation chaperone [Halonotius aquaticus]RJX43212.1 HypC/HybG/HupF family hydrogenase formation chaperone [Halonotius aquaticus]
MCLGVPGEIVEIDDHEAVADFWGVERRVRLDVVGDAVDVGDYILNHAGFAIRKIPEQEVEETIAIYESLFGDDAEEALDEIGAPRGADIDLGGEQAAVEPEGGDDD